MADNSILENILYVIKMRGEYKAKTCQIFVNLSGFFYVQNFSCSLCFHKNNARAPPFLSILKNSKSKGESKMAEREKYFIALDGQAFEVSRELYEAYYKGRRKEKYFTHDLKQEHTKVDKETGQITVIPSREDSYERLLAAEKQFAEDAEDIEDAAIRAVMPYIPLRMRKQRSSMPCSIRKSARWNWQSRWEFHGLPCAQGKTGY